MEKKEIIDVEANSISQVIDYAIRKDTPVDQLEKFLLLKERFEANAARKVYNANMVLVQQEITSVTKTKKNSQTNSKYADLGDIISQTKKTYTKHGFSVSFYEGDTPKPGHIRICADVVHGAGHKETYHYDVPLDGVGIKGNANMTAIHGKASSTSYAQRYLMCMIWNIPIADNDAQGIGQAVEYITDKERSELLDMCADCSVSMPKFIAYLKVEDLSKLPKTDFQKAKLALIAKKGQKAAK